MGTDTHSRAIELLNKMKLAFLYGLINAESEKWSCPVGTSVGINLNGRSRPENTNICYPTYRGARVVACNNKQGGVEMTAVFQGSFLSDVPLDFVQPGEGFYLGRFDETQLDVKFTKAGLVMTKTISISASPEVLLRSRFRKRSKPMSLKFTCKFGTPEPISLKSSQARGMSGYIFVVLIFFVNKKLTLE